jgi:hypothetical protein
LDLRRKGPLFWTIFFYCIAEADLLDEDMLILKTQEGIHIIGWRVAG